MTPGLTSDDGHVSRFVTHAHVKRHTVLTRKSLYIQVLQEYDEVRAADPTFSTQVCQQLQFAVYGSLCCASARLRASNFLSKLPMQCWPLTIMSAAACDANLGACYQAVTVHTTLFNCHR